MTLRLEKKSRDENAGNWGRQKGNTEGIHRDDTQAKMNAEGGRAKITKNLRHKDNQNHE